jgi:hypothetical protein
MFVDAVNNRVGILTTTPTSPLQVGGVVYSTVGGFKFPDNTTQTSAGVHRTGDTMTGSLTITGAGLTVDSADNTLVVDATNNRVGIGTASPARPLEISTSVADYLVHLKNTSASGASGIAFSNTAGTEKMRVGYGNPSFSSPTANLNFIHTDGVTDTVIAHAGVEFHRFLSSGVVKFDQADSTLVIDSGANRVGIGTASPASGFVVDMASTSGANGKILRVQNTNANGYGAIEFLNSAGSSATIGYGGTGVTAGGANVFSLDLSGIFSIRSGLTSLFSFDNTGTFICNPAGNTLFVDSGGSRVGVNTSSFTGAGGFSHPFIVDLGSTGTRSALVKGAGTIRKGISIQDSTNNRTWTVDHATSGNNNRLETFYHNGTSEVRILTLTTDGKLGLNNTTPTVELDVAGSGSISGGLTVDTTTLVVDAAGNRVGINTTPAAGNTLDVSGTIKSSAAAVTGITGTGITVDYVGQLRRGFYKVTIANTAWTAAATTEDKTLCTIPARGRIVSVIADTTVAYAGTGASSYSLRLGTTAGGQELIVDHSVLATTTKGLADADLGTSINRANAVQGGHIPSWTTSTDLKVRLTSDVNISNITAGTTTFYITVEIP